MTIVKEGERGLAAAVVWSWSGSRWRPGRGGRCPGVERLCAPYGQRPLSPADTGRTNLPSAVRPQYLRQLSQLANVANLLTCAFSRHPTRSTATNAQVDSFASS